MRKRLDLEAQYDIKCRLLDSAVLSTLRTLADHMFEEVEHVCDGGCIMLE